MTEIQCPWCDHVTTADEPVAAHELAFSHAADAHGRRRQPCGCSLEADAHRYWWMTCDGHAAAYLRLLVGLQVENWRAGTFRAPDPQPTLDFTGSAA